MALPDNINYTTVVGRFIRAVADTADAGKEPDVSPAVGLSIVFQPSVDVVTDDAATPPVTIVIDPITCTTDAQGYLLGPDGTAGVMLIASADEDLRPHHWTWAATITGTNYRRVSSTFMTEPGATIDLSTVVQVPASPGEALVQWQAAVIAAEAARDEVLAALEDLPAGGGSTAWVDLTGVPSTFTPSAHSHATSEVVGLDTALAGKAATSHTHSTANVTGLDAALAAKAPLASPAFTGTPTGITKAHVGLGSVDNTSDLAKPVSTATQSALDAKAPIASPTFTGTVSGVTKTHVGLGSVDNTSDLAKPISTATQTALDGKAATSHTHTTANVTGLDTALSAKAPLASPAFTGTPTGITKSHVGLGLVDNTADTAKPVSTAQAAAIAAKVGSPNSTVSGLAWYATVGELPATGTPGVFYFVDAV